MKTIGIIGGLGPMATAYFMELITRMTDVDSDQKHPRVYIESVPDLPDRTAYILGKNQESPLPGMIKAGKELTAIGAELLTIPCVTAHYFYQQMQEEMSIPVLNLPELIAHMAKEKGIKRLGIMATNGTIESGVLSQKLAEEGLECVVPSEEKQKLVMEIIYGQVKKGTRVDWDMFRQVACELQEKGAEKIILGCTELPLLKRETAYLQEEATKDILEKHCIDVLEVLAREAILRCGAPLRAEYQELFE